MSVDDQSGFVWLQPKNGKKHNPFSCWYFMHKYHLYGVWEANQSNMPRFTHWKVTYAIYHEIYTIVVTLQFTWSLVIQHAFYIVFKVSQSIIYFYVCLLCRKTALWLWEDRHVTLFLVLASMFVSVIYRKWRKAFK